MELPTLPSPDRDKVNGALLRVDYLVREQAKLQRELARAVEELMGALGTTEIPSLVTRPPLKAAVLAVMRPGGVPMKADAILEALKEAGWEPRNTVVMSTVRTAILRLKREGVIERVTGEKDALYRLKPAGKERAADAVVT